MRYPTGQPVADPAAVTRLATLPGADQAPTFRETRRLSTLQPDRLSRADRRLRTPGGDRWPRAH